MKNTTYIAAGEKETGEAEPAQTKKVSKWKVYKTAHRFINLSKSGAQRTREKLDEEKEVGKVNRVSLKLAAQRDAAPATDKLTPETAVVAGKGGQGTQGGNTGIK